MNQRLWPWALALALAVAVLVAYLASAFPNALEDEDGPRRLIAMLGWLVLVSSSLLLHFRARPGTALKQGAIWVAIGLVLVVGYSYRDQFSELQARVMGELVPERGTSIGEDGVRFRASADGHFHVRAEVDGTPISFIVDSGATEVVLSPADARRLGFNPEQLDFTLTAETANGMGRAAPVQLGEIAVGPVRLTNVTASVNQAELGASLLGMSFLNRLSGYEVRNGTLTLWH